MEGFALHTSRKLVKLDRLVAPRLEEQPITAPQATPGSPEP